MLVRRQAIRHFSRSNLFSGSFSSNKKFSTIFSSKEQPKNETYWWKIGAAACAISLVRKYMRLNSQFIKFDQKKKGIFME